MGGAAIQLLLVAVATAAVGILYPPCALGLLLSCLLLLLLPPCGPLYCPTPAATMRQVRLPGLPQSDCQVCSTWGRNTGHLGPTTHSL